MKLTQKEIRDAANAAALKVLDKNSDGKIDREDAKIMATGWESRFPIGVIVGCTAAGGVIGFWLRGLFA